MTQRSLRFEQLERRLLLAGIVKVGASRGDLIVTGDQPGGADFDEMVEIAFLGDTLGYRVKGLVGTQLVYNGQAGTEFDVLGIKRDVIVDMKTGTDNVSIVMGPSDSRFKVPRNLTIKGGVGVDTVVVENADVSGKMALDGGLENNRFDVRNTTVKKDVSIKTGNGDGNEVLLEQATLNGKLTVTTGIGSDQKVSLKGGSTITKDVAVKTGNGDRNEVLFEQATLNGKLTVTTGTGNERKVSLSGGSVAKDVSIKTGNGDDAIEIVDGELLGKLTISAGNGDNFVTIDPTTISKNVSILTGAGVDDVLLDHVTLGVGTAAAKLTISTGSGNDRVGLLDSTTTGNISISTGNDNDGVGLVRVQTPGHITVSAGNGDTGEEGLSERIGLAGVTAKNVTLDGGSTGTRPPWGRSQIGVTGSVINGNLTIKTGNAPDEIGIGSGDEILARLADLLVDRNGDPIDLTGATGRVHVDNGTVSITTGKYCVSDKYPDLELDCDDWVLIDNASAKVFRLDTGRGNDNAKIAGDVAAAQEVTVKMADGDDWLTLAVPLEQIPNKRLVDGGKAGQDTLENPYELSHPLPPALAAVFRNWETFEDLDLDLII